MVYLAHTLELLFENLTSPELVLLIPNEKFSTLLGGKRLYCSIICVESGWDPAAASFRDRRRGARAFCPSQTSHSTWICIALRLSAQRSATSHLDLTTIRSLLSPPTTLSYRLAMSLGTPTTSLPGQRTRHSNDLAQLLYLTPPCLRQ